MSYKFDRTLISQGIDIKDVGSKLSNDSTIEVEVCNYSDSVPKFVQNCNGSPNGLAWILGICFFVFTPVGRWILNANILGIFIATRRR